MAQIIWFLLFLGQTSLFPYQNLLLEPFIPAHPSSFRTFPAAIAGQGDYFHYDIDTKEAVSFYLIPLQYFFHQSFGWSAIENESADETLTYTS